MEDLSEQEKQRVNAQSIAIAKFAATQVATPKGKKAITPEEFLPFPPDQPDKVNTVNPKTAIVMKRLIESGRLPTRVEAAAKARLNG